MNTRKKQISRGGTEFDNLPFEIQKEVFQYLLVAGVGHILRPEERHSRVNERCFPRPIPYYSFNSWYPGACPDSPPQPARKPCYHETLNTHVLYVNKNMNSVAVQVLYGCNRFHFSAASLFNRFTDTISNVGEFFERTPITPKSC